MSPPIPQLLTNPHGNETFMHIPKTLQSLMMIQLYLGGLVQGFVPQPHVDQSWSEIFRIQLNITSAISHQMTGSFEWKAFVHVSESPQNFMAIRWAS